MLELVTYIKKPTERFRAKLSGILLFYFNCDFFDHLLEWQTSCVKSDHNIYVSPQLLLYKLFPE